MAASSLTNRFTPRDDPAEPLRIRENKISPVSERVVAELAGVAVSGALFGVTVDLADRGVEIDHQRIVAGSGAEFPRPGQQPGCNGVELADEPERESAQERADRRGCHHLERQHRLGRARPDHIGVVDVGGPGEHRRDQRAHLPARVGGSGANPSCRELFETEPRHQRGGDDQSGIGDQTVMVEGRVVTVNGARYWPHRKCLPNWMER
jgi:hypothetical protein